MANENKQFEYSYSAKEQAEIKRIREKYAQKEQPAEENKMALLRRLDESVTKKGTIISLILGVIGTLIMGFGMSLFMSELGDAIGLSSALSMSIGVGTGFVGILLIALAYPAYMHITKKERKRIAPEIIRLADELMK